MATINVKFKADGSGNSLIFKASTPAEITVDNVSLKEVTTEAIPINYSVKEFLTGTTDEGSPIFFRADSQKIQLNAYMENFSQPISIINKTQRGSLIRCFIALDDDDFYEIQGNVTKGVSVLKVNSRKSGTTITPPMAREITISWRDSSKQLCRIIQSSVVFIETTMGYLE